MKVFGLHLDFGLENTGDQFGRQFNFIVIFFTIHNNGLDIRNVFHVDQLLNCHTESVNIFGGHLLPLGHNKIATISVSRLVAHPMIMPLGQDQMGPDYRWHLTFAFGLLEPLLRPSKPWSPPS